MSLSLKLFHFPGVACAKKFREIAGASLCNNVLDLLVHDVFIAGKIIPRTKHADRRWETRPMLHVRKEERVRSAWMMCVVDDEVGFGNAVAELDDFDVAVGLATNAFVAVLAEDKRLAVFQLDDVLAARVALSEVEPRAIVE